MAALEELLLAANEPMAIIRVDLDDMKRLNDRLGHAEGDRAIREAGLRIASTIEQSVTARLGGDEFASSFSLAGSPTEHSKSQRPGRGGGRRRSPLFTIDGDGAAFVGLGWCCPAGAW